MLIGLDVVSSSIFLYKFFSTPIFFALGLEICIFPIYNTSIKWFKLKWL